MYWIETLKIYVYYIIITLHKWILFIFLYFFMCVYLKIDILSNIFSCYILQVKTFFRAYMIYILYICRTNDFLLYTSWAYNNIIISNHPLEKYKKNCSSDFLSILPCALFATDIWKIDFVQTYTYKIITFYYRYIP